MSNLCEIPSGASDPSQILDLWGYLFIVTLLSVQTIIKFSETVVEPLLWMWRHATDGTFGEQWGRIQQPIRNISCVLNFAISHYGFLDPLCSKTLRTVMNIKCKCYMENLFCWTFDRNRIEFEFNFKQISKAIYNWNNIPFKTVKLTQTFKIK